MNTKVRITATRKLSFPDGTHVRAGSALIRLRDGSLLVVQDDASYLAKVSHAKVTRIDLPYAPFGLKIFEERQNTKALKLDLEAAASFMHPKTNHETVWIFGSGSTPVRTRIAILSERKGHFETQLVEASLLYEEMRKNTAFAGGELNIEGACVKGDSLFLFQRGNGLEPRVNGRIEYRLSEVDEYFQSLGKVIPQPLSVNSFDLGHARPAGSTDGSPSYPYAFTDASLGSDDRIYFLAAAEATDNAYDDGEALGAKLGWFDQNDQVRLLPMEELDGTPFKKKAEGLVVSQTSPSIRGYLVIDADDPDAACELCEWEVV